MSEKPSLMVRVAVGKAIGLAFGLSEKDVALEQNFVPLALASTGTE